MLVIRSVLAHHQRGNLKVPHSVLHSAGVTWYICSNIGLCSATKAIPPAPCVATTTTTLATKTFLRRWQPRCRCSMPPIKTP